MKEIKPGGEQISPGCSTAGLLKAPSLGSQYLSVQSLLLHYRVKEHSVGNLQRDQRLPAPHTMCQEAPSQSSLCAAEQASCARPAPSGCRLCEQKATPLLPHFLQVGLSAFPSLAIQTGVNLPPPCARPLLHFLLHTSPHVLSTLHPVFVCLVPVTLPTTHRCGLREGLSMLVSATLQRLAQDLGYS